jgi:hypothetical protein
LDAARFAKREQLINQLYSREIVKVGGHDSFGTDGYDRRSFLDGFVFTPPKIRSLLHKIFAPKFPRILAIMAMLMIAQWLLGGVYALIPFVLAASALYCLAEDTETSRKLLIVIVSKLAVVARRSS